MILILAFLAFAACQNAYAEKKCSVFPSNFIENHPIENFLEEVTKVVLERIISSKTQICFLLALSPIWSCQILDT